MRKVLSIDGGGIKGLIPAMVCREIERRSGRPLAETFDLIAGTSTGAIISAALGAGLEAARIVQLYHEEGPRIFRKPRPLLVQLKRAKYRGSRLYDVLKEYLGGIALGDVRTNVMTTAYDVAGRWAASGNPGPVFFKSWRVQLQAVPLVDAVQASSAAPGYFPPHRVAVPWKSDEWACLYDGGLYAGDPALCAYAEARSLWPGEEIDLVSLGTGSHEVRTKCSEAVGLIRLARRVHGWMLDGSADTVPYVSDRILPRYVRIDAYMDRPVAMDDASEPALRVLVETAERAIAMHDEALDRIAELPA